MTGKIQKWKYRSQVTNCMEKNGRGFSMNVWDHKTDWHFEENELNSVYFSAQGFSPAGLRVHVQLSWNEHAEGQVFLPIHQETAEGVQLFPPCPTIRTSTLDRRTSLIRIKSCGFCDIVSLWFCPGTQSKPSGLCWSHLCMTWNWHRHQLRTDFDCY